MEQGDMTELQVATAGMHELYLSLMEAGFTARQALFLVSCQMGAREEDVPDGDGGGE